MTTAYLGACSCIRSQLLIHAVAKGGVSQGLMKSTYTVDLVKRQVDSKLNVYY